MTHGEYLDPALLDDLFHACAFEAYVAEARRADGAPDSDTVRRAAFSFYETALAERRRQPPRA